MNLTLMNMLFVITIAWVAFLVDAFPIGVNLSPLGGNIYDMGGTYGGNNWDAISTYAFVNIFKHCTALYIRSTNNNGATFGYQSNAAATWRGDGYPATLQYTSATIYHVAMCDIGAGGNFVADGVYSVSWQGTGSVGFSPSTATVLSYDRVARQATVRISASTSTAGVNVRLWGAGLNPVLNVSIVPLAFAQNYTTQIFQPTFLSIVSRFPLIRFTGWQKAGNAGRTWAGRTTPASQSQHRADGVALEHIIDLIRVTNVSSIWLSFPLTSSDYNKNAVTLIANSLNRLLDMNPTRSFTVYYEAGCQEVNSDSDTRLESLALFTFFDTIFKRNTTMSSRLTLKATVSINNYQYIPYIYSRFGSAINRIDAVGVPGQFGRSSQANERYNSYSIWDNTYANFTTAQLLAEFRASVLVAEFMFNNMRQILLDTPNVKPNLEFVSYSSGGYASANGYGYRAGLSVVQSCLSKSTYPCNWANTGYNFKNASQIQAAMPAIITNATKEQAVQDRLMIAMRDPAMFDLILDLMERWNRIGGGAFISPMLVKPVQPCTNGGKGCGNEAMFESPLFLSRCSSQKGCPQYSSLLAYQDGIRSRLPFTSADLPPHPSTIGMDTCSSGCRWGTCWLGVCHCFAGYSGASCTDLDQSAPNNCNKNVGMNVGGVVDYSTDIAFVDVFTAGRAWISQKFYNSPWSTGSPQLLSANGYPAKLAKSQKLGSMMIRDLAGRVAAGVYVVLYDGDGILDFSMDVLAVKRGVGRIEITVKPSTGLNNGIFLSILRTNPVDPIRNIRVVMPGYEGSFVAFPFHPLFLNSMKQYSTIRFMGWQNTNNVPTGNWSMRTSPATAFSYSSSGNGVPIEKLILLSNTLGASAWFNMPHLCSDDFVTKFATLVVTTLRPDVDVVIEYSNEVWGTLFSGGQYAQQQGLALGLSTSTTTARFCFYMLRSSQIFRIWKNVFALFSATNPRTGRLRFIIASQAVNYDVTRQLLQCPSVSSIDLRSTSIAIAPYFGTYSPARDTNLDVFMTATLPAQISSLSTQLAGHLLWAKKFNMTLVTYECGIGLAGSGTASDLAIQANRDQRMTGLYQRYLNLLYSYSINTIMIFQSAGLYSYTQAWGTLEASNQNPISSPKFVGISNFISQHVTPTSCVVGQPALNAPPLSCPLGCSQAGVCNELTGQCECFYGASGAGCEIVSYTKHTDQCGYFCTFNQGTCIPDYISGNDMYYKCVCNPGYYGLQCSAFDCPNSCNSNGQCVDSNVCACYPGFMGTECQVDCGCDGHGVCIKTTYEGILPQYGDNLKSNVDLVEQGQTCLCDVGYMWSSAVNKCIFVKNPIAPPTVVQTSCSRDTCKFGTCLSDTECACWAGYNGDYCDQPTSRPNSESVIGTTLSGIAYYSQEWTFVDAMKMSSDWVSVDDSALIPTLYQWGNGMNISLRADGYPSKVLRGQILVKLMLRDIHLHAPAGKYVCLYDGDGVLDFGMDARVVSMSKGRIEFIFTPTTVVGCTAAYCSDNGIFLRLLKTNESNPIHNIRVIMPGFEKTYDKIPFHPTYLKNLEHYSTLRFMGWQNTNNNIEVSWSDRSLTNHASQNRGVALEHMIDLANILGANVWFSMPHGADDNYFTQFATMVRDRLRPDVKIYLEYSNEVWNLLFSQAKYARQRGLALGLSTDAYTAQYRFYSQRSVELFTIFKNVFLASGGASNANRLINVLSTFTISPSTTTTILSWKSAYSYANVVAVAPYFDCGLSNNVALASLMNVTSVLGRCMNSMQSITTTVQAIVTVANSFGLPVMTYEAGQSLVQADVIQYNTGPNPIVTALFIATNRDPRMQYLYQAYIDALIAVGAVSRDRPLMQFTSVGNPTQYGSWGALEYTGMPIQAAPKFMSLQQYFFNVPTAAPSLKSMLCSTESQASILTTGADDSVYVGFPAVTSPRRHEVWTTGSKQLISWDASGMDSSATASLLLRRGGYCRDGSFVAPAEGVLSIVLSSNVRLSPGAFSLTLPLDVLSTFGISAAKGTFFVEIRPTGAMDSLSSNFSEYFDIVTRNAIMDLTLPQYGGNSSHCCNGLLIPDIDYCYSVAIALTGIPSDTLKQMPTCGNDWQFRATYSKWIGSCSVDSMTGCRIYRTAANGKPVTNCVSQWSNDFASTYYWALVKDTVTSCMNSNAPTTSCTSITGDDNYCHLVPIFSTLFEWRAPTALPTAVPTAAPTAVPTKVPTAEPTFAPTQQPVISPTARPSFVPTRPTAAPSAKPTAGPSRQPTRRPTAPPTDAPTRRPTQTPTRRPTAPPTDAPTRRPTQTPTRRPTASPTQLPTRRPTAIPSARPTAKPVASPSRSPTRVPTTKAANLVPVPL